MQNGGRREGAGRKQGSINKVKLELRAAAREHTQAALDTLVEIMNDTMSPHAARISAANIGCRPYRQYFKLNGAMGAIQW